MNTVYFPFIGLIIGLIPFIVLLLRRSGSAGSLGALGIGWYSPFGENLRGVMKEEGSFFCCFIHLFHPFLKGSVVVKSVLKTAPTHPAICLWKNRFPRQKALFSQSPWRPQRLDLSAIIDQKYTVIHIQHLLSNPSFKLSCACSYSPK